MIFKMNVLKKKKKRVLVSFSENSLASDGIQGTLPLNLATLHIVYFNLKDFEKMAEAEVQSDIPHHQHPSPLHSPSLK